MNWEASLYTALWLALWAPFSVRFIANPIRTRYMGKKALPVNAWRTYRNDPVYIIVFSALMGLIAH